MLKNYLSDQSLGKQSLKSTLDQSSVATTEQKTTGMGLGSQNNKNELSKRALDEEEDKKRKAKLEAQKNNDNNKSHPESSKKIERDPMILLKVF